MRISRALPVTFIALALAACGSSKKSSGADAHVATIDAGNPADAGTPDAPMTAPVTGLGQVCDSSVTPTTCPTGAPDCVGLANSAEFCSLGCATSTWPKAAAMPTQLTQQEQMTANAKCVAQWKGMKAPAGATPFCAIYAGAASQTMDTTATWSCALLCGTYTSGSNTVNFGVCPGGLTCVPADNLCE